MKNKRFLAAILLGMVLCFVSGVGYGEIPGELAVDKAIAWTKQKVSLLDYFLLEARVNYMMRNFSGYDWVMMGYDLDGSFRDFYKLPNNVRTAGKIVVEIQDHRGELPLLIPVGEFSLLETFEMQLTTIYGYIEVQFPLDMDSDIVAILKSKEDIPLGYFYQGEYHLWEE